MLAPPLATAVSAALRGSLDDEYDTLITVNTEYCVHHTLAARQGVRWE